MKLTAAAVKTHLSRCESLITEEGLDVGNDNDGDGDVMLLTHPQGKLISLVVLPHVLHHQLHRVRVGCLTVEI